MTSPRRRSKPLGWLALLALLVLPAVLSAPGPAAATSPSDLELGIFDRIITSLLDSNCSGLQGSSGAYGPQLAAICAIPGTSNNAISTGLVSGISGQGAAGDERRVRQRQASFRGDQADGADGASLRLGALGLFASFDYENFAKNSTTFEPGIDSNAFGVTVGADLRLTDWLVVGAALNYAYLDGTFRRRGGDFTTHAGGPTLYLSLLPWRGLFVDVAAGYARKGYSIDRRIDYSFVRGGTTINVSGVAAGDPDGNEYRASILAGYDFRLGPVTAGPRAGVNWVHNAIDGFEERGNTGLELRYDAQDETSLATTLGAFASWAISLPWGVLVPQATAAWVHEFEDDQRVIYFSFVQDLTGARFRFFNDPPDRNYVRLAAGISAVLPGGLTPYLSYRAIVGYRHQATHTVNIGLRFAF